MSNTDFDNVVSADAYRARNFGITAVEDDPEHAAEALRLGSMTGVPAPAVLADLDEFKLTQRRKSTQDLIAGSPALQDYINSHPLAASLSNDDLDRLDTAGTHLRNTPTFVPQVPEGQRGEEWFSGANPNPASLDQLHTGLVKSQINNPEEHDLLTGAAQGFLKGFGDQPVGSWIPQKDLDINENPLAWYALSTYGMPTEVALRTLGGLIGAATEGAVEQARAAAPGIDLLSKATGGAIRSGESFARDVGGELERRTTEPGHAAHVIAQPDLFQRGQFVLAQERARPYLERGEEPPTGLHPIIDEIKAQKAKANAEWLQEAERHANASSTRERAPDFYANFVRQNSDVELGVSAEAVRKLYGDKPLDGEGPLAYVPNLREQVELAETYGGDVVVPVADWLAHTDPEVQKGLRDNVRIGRRGMTLEEAKEKEQLSVEAPSIDTFETSVNAIRHLAQMDPAEVKIRLQRILPNEQGSTPNPYYGMAPQEIAAALGRNWADVGVAERLEFAEQSTRQNQTNRTKFGPEQGFHDFEMLDGEGKGIGSINLSEQKDGLYVEMIQANKGPNTLGPRTQMDILRQIAEAFPEKNWVEGYRVSGARERAGEKFATVRVPLRRPVPIKQLEQFFEGWTHADGLDKPDTTGYRDIGLGTKVLDVDEAALPEKQQQIIAKVDELLARIAPTVRAEPVGDIAHPSGVRTTGIYSMYKDAEPAIRWALDGPDAEGTARHEAIHHLRQYGFFSPTEWTALERAARQGGWLEKHGIETRYKDASAASKLEEAVAEEYRTWAKDPARYQGPAATIFAKIKELMDWIAKTLRETFGDTVTADEIFAAVEKGFIGGREGTTPLHEGAFQARQEGAAPPPFATGSAFGSNERNAGRYAKLISERNAKDFDAALKRAETQERREQTQEWKQNYAAMRDETTAQVDARPDVAALNALNDRVWLGERLDHSLRLDPDLVPADLREAVPKHWLERDGLAPDTMAQILGYPDGRSMLEATMAVEASRKAEGLTYARWRERQIKSATDARMAAAYGDLKENIHDAAVDQALSETQMELLSEETRALAEQSGQAPPLTKDQMRVMARDHFDKQPAKGMKPEDYLSAAGRAGRRVEDALLAGKPLEAFHAKQQQFAATLMAKEAQAWAKDQAKLDRLIKRLTPHHIETMEPAYGNYAQELLAKAGVPIRRTMTDIQLGIAHEGHGSYGEFLAANFREGGELFATPEMQAGAVKPYDQMTVGERRDFDRALRSLWEEGRATQKLIVAGERYDLDQVRGEIRDNIKQLPLIKEANRFRDWAYGFDAMITKPEEMLKDLDLRQTNGPLFKYVMVPMADAKAHEYTMLNQLVTKLRAISGDFRGEWMKTLNDTIPQTHLVDPADGVPLALRRENLIQIMLNWGTASSRKKFADGWGRSTSSQRLDKAASAAFEQKITDLINQHATKKDWEYVQRVWDVFADWKPLTDTVYRNLSGSAPKWIPNESLRTTHGEVEGKYFPIIYDPFYGDIDSKRAMQPAVGAFPADYYRSTTGNGYTIDRTGYTDRIQFMRPLETVASRMQQIIHDIAFREAVINTNKILYDKGITAAITRHYGKAYKDNLQAWVHRVANETNLNERELESGYGTLRRFRLNLIGHALPFNLNVLLSPDMGTANPVVLGQFLRAPKENMAFVMEHSKEVQHMVYNMDRDFREALTSTIGKDDLLDRTRRFMIEKGFKPATFLSQQFRAATWFADYNAKRGEGFSHYDAAHLADSTVRERHGAASIVDLPSIMASNEAMKTFTMFYGYFNTMQNWMRQVPGNVRRGEWDRAVSAMWGTVGIGALFGAGLFNKQTEKDGWFKIMSKAVTLQVVQGLPFARDIGTYAWEGYSPRSAFASAAVAIKAMVDDTFAVLSGKKAKKPIAHLGNAIGSLTGLPMAQVSRTAQFFRDVSTGQQHPRDIIEWMRGIRTGEARLPKR